RLAHRTNRSLWRWSMGAASARSIQRSGRGRAGTPKWQRLPAPARVASLAPMTRVKICGVTQPGDAELCVEAGADAIGLNFFPGSPRCVDAATARRIVSAIGGRALAVGV